MTIRLPDTESHFIRIATEIVDVYMSFLLGLDALEKLKVILDFDEEEIKLKKEG